MTTQQTQSSTRRRLTGVVVSDKMEKTIVVRVDRTLVHPMYGKRYVTSKKYHVHDPDNAHKMGETVVIVEDQPRSRHKKWRVLKKAS